MSHTILTGAALKGHESTKNVPPFQLLQWKHAIKLEKLGMKSRHGSVTKFACQKLGCTRKNVLDTIEACLAAYRIEQKID